jgi:hypothetical protein
LRLCLSQYGEEFELADPDLVAFFQTVFVAMADRLIGVVDEGAIDAGVFQINTICPHLHGRVMAGNETFRIRQYQRVVVRPANGAGRRDFHLGPSTELVCIRTDDLKSNAHVSFDSTTRTVASLQKRRKTAENEVASASE